VEAELKMSYPKSTIILIQGAGGVFDVKCDGKLIYSKQHIEGRRFPQQGEITKLVESEIG